MNDKNKKNPSDVSQSGPMPTTVNVDKTVHKLITRTAERNNLGTKVLVNLSMQAMLGSLETYGYDPMGIDIGNLKPTKGSIEGPPITVTGNAAKQLKAIAILFGVHMGDVLRDAILAQRYNWQRMQPVNARSMSSIRLQMFEQEQLGPR